MEGPVGLNDRPEDTRPRQMWVWIFVAFTVKKRFPSDLSLAAGKARTPAVPSSGPVGAVRYPTLPQRGRVAAAPSLHELRDTV